MDIQYDGGKCAWCGSSFLVPPSKLSSKQPYSHYAGSQLDFRNYSDTTSGFMLSFENSEIVSIVRPLVCTSCYAVHHPMWSTRADYGTRRFLHVRPSELNFVFYSQCGAVAVKLLRWFEKLWVRDGTRFENFTLACTDMGGIRREHLRQDFLHAYILWSALIWAEEDIIRSNSAWLSSSQSGSLQCGGPYIDCSIGNHGRDIDAFLKRVRPLWYNPYMQTWVGNHASLCSPECARFIVHDGSAKLYREGCPVETEPTIFQNVRVRKQCGRSLCCVEGCAYHGRSSLQSCEPPPKRPRKNGCGTLKERHHKNARPTTFGCMGCAFTCGTLGPFHEIAFAESCSQLYVIQHELKQWNAEFKESIYDDGCHQEEFWSTRPSLAFPGWTPRHTIDRCHEPGHKRLRCRTTLSADTNPRLYTYLLTNEDVSSDDVVVIRRAVTRDGVFKKIIAVGGVSIPVGARLRRVAAERMDPYADLLTALIGNPLPLDIVLQKNDTRYEIKISSSRERATLVEGLNARMRTSWMGVRRFRDASKSPLLLPYGALLTGVGPFLRSSWPTLLAALQSQQLAPLRMTIVKTKNTQVMEQHWRVFNRHKATLRHATKMTYDFLLHRLGHLLNTRLWAEAI